MPHDADDPPRKPVRTPVGGIRVGQVDVVAYLSHTLGSSNGEDSIRRHDNIANAGRWLNFIVEAVPWIVVMPWYPYVSLNVQRERGFADQLRYIKYCHALMLCGGVVSSHMTYEIEHAKRARVALLDLTDFGYYPPIVEPTSLRDVLEDRMRLAMAEVGRVM